MSHGAYLIGRSRRWKDKTDTTPVAASTQV